MYELVNSYKKYQIGNILPPICFLIICHFKFGTYENIWLQWSHLNVIVECFPSKTFSYMHKFSTEPLKMNSFYCPDFRDMSHMWYLRSSLTPLSTLLILSQFPLIPSHNIKTISSHSYMILLYWFLNGIICVLKWPK